MLNAPFQSGHREGLNEEDAKELVLSAIAAGITNDLGSGSNIDVCVITKERGLEHHRGAYEDPGVTYDDAQSFTAGEHCTWVYLLSNTSLSPFINKRPLQGFGGTSKFCNRCLYFPSVLHSCVALCIWGVTVLCACFERRHGAGFKWRYGKIIRCSYA